MGAVGMNGEKIKNSLSYSPMTDTVYWVDGKGEKTDVSDQFYYVLGAMVDNTDKGFKLDYKNAGFTLQALKTPLDHEHGHHGQYKGGYVGDVFVEPDKLTIYARDGSVYKYRGVIIEDEIPEV